MLSKIDAQQRLAKRSMFAREFTVLLIIMSSYDPNKEDYSSLNEIYAQALGKATFFDLVFKLSAYHARTEWQESVHALKHADNDLHFIYRLICSALTLISVALMFPVNMVYGALDWLGLKAALLYIKHTPGGMNEKTVLSRATYVSLFVSILTLPVRIAFGLVEALQEPLHLYDFWVKGAVDATNERKNHEISFGVYALKLSLHAFKVICTLGAVLSIVGITSIPFISKGFDYLGKIAYGFIDVKNAIPAHKYIFDMPVKGLEQVLVGVETACERITGVHYSFPSKHSNAQDAIKLGFESAFTKAAGLLPKEEGFAPVDLLGKNNKPSA